MPRIQDIVLTMVFYVYPSKESAISGDDSGGTGFIYFVPTEFDPKLGYHHAVTNAHVVFNGDYDPVLRINTKDGKFDIIETSQSQWIRHPDGDDVTVALISLRGEIHDYGCFREENVLNEQFIEEHDVGVGDDVIMVGRFRVNAGKQKNTPAAMFGNISMMNEEPLYNPFTQLSQESLLVEMRSISGFSGSPVMLYIPNLSLRPKKQNYENTWHLRLMGICWGQINVPVKGYDADNNEYRITLDSAMTAVVPIWKILDVINGEDMKKIRKKLDEVAKKKTSESPIELMSNIEAEST